MVHYQLKSAASSSRLVANNPSTQRYPLKAGNTLDMTGMRKHINRLHR